MAKPSDKLQEHAPFRAWETEVRTTRTLERAVGCFFASFGISTWTTAASAQRLSRLGDADVVRLTIGT